MGEPKRRSLTPEFAGVSRNREVAAGRRGRVFVRPVAAPSGAKRTHPNQSSRREARGTPSASQVGAELLA
jgi:hypothetical protein